MDGDRRRGRRSSVIKATFSKKGSASVSVSIENAQKRISADVVKNLKLATLKVHENAVRGLSKRSEGERQVRYNPRREVVASRPGDPPNIDTRRFLSSVKFEFFDKEGQGFAGTNDVRGPWFEFGTKNMKPRPWLRPAWNQSLEFIRKLFKEMGKK